MRKLLISSILLIITLISYAQNYNSDRVTFTNFLVRMYNNAPFEGVRMVKDYENTYLISVVLLNPTDYDSESTLNEVATVVSMAQISDFNSAKITSDIIIHIDKTENGKATTKKTTTIKKKSANFVNSLEQLTNFTREDGMQVFIFIKPMEYKK